MGPARTLRQNPRLLSRQIRPSGHATALAGSRALNLSHFINLMRCARTHSNRRSRRRSLAARKSTPAQCEPSYSVQTVGQEIIELTGRTVELGGGGITFMPAKSLAWSVERVASNQRRHGDPSRNGDEHFVVQHGTSVHHLPARTTQICRSAVGQPR